MTRHIPTTSHIIDQLTTRLESDEPDQAEHEALTRALMPLEDYMARTARIEALTTAAELSIAIRTTRQPDRDRATAMDERSAR